MGGVWSDPLESSSERDQLLQQRGEHIMSTLCNQIEVNPLSEHVQKLVSEYKQCMEGMTVECTMDLRRILLKTLCNQIDLEIVKENGDDARLQFLKDWFDELTNKSDMT